MQRSSDAGPIGSKRETSHRVAYLACLLPSGRALGHRSGSSPTPPHAPGLARAEKAHSLRRAVPAPLRPSPSTAVTYSSEAETADRLNVSVRGGTGIHGMSVRTEKGARINFRWFHREEYMSRDRRLIDLAVDEAIETLAAIERVEAALRAVLANSQISESERLAISALLASARVTAQATASATAKAELADRIIDAQKRSSGVNRDLRRQAESLGLPIIELHFEPDMPSPEAA